MRIVTLGLPKDSAVPRPPDAGMSETVTYAGQCGHRLIVELLAAIEPWLVGS